METSVSFSQRLNKIRNLALQGAAELSAPSADRAPASEYYVEFGSKTPLLRKLGDTEAMHVTAETLADLAERDQARTLDLVFVENSCIDLKFRLPDALLPELRQIVENEIQFRSPFSEDASYWFWVSEEQPDGHWQSRAAVSLKKPIDEILSLLSDRGFKPGIVRRVGQEISFAARPTWAGHHMDEKPARVLSSLPRSLKLSLAGAAIFLISAIASTVQGNMAQSRLSAEADAARASLAAQAQASAGIRNLDQSVSRAADKLAMTGILSELLPDGVWLDQLIIDDETVTFVGFGPSAAEITRLLATLPLLKDIRFASPVTRDNTQSLERFRIAATLAGATP